jgi:hypothetical protein
MVNYVADFAQQNAVHTTRANSKAEVEQAKVAYELIQAACYSSYQEVIHDVKDSNTTHMPSLLGHTGAIGAAMEQGLCTSEGMCRSPRVRSIIWP